jgi:hypothetical protein
MLKTSFDGALSAARTLTHVNDLAHELWQAYGAGKITDTEAENLAARIEDRRREIRPQDRTAVRAPQVPRVAKSFFPPKRRYSSSPDRAASRARRRDHALSGPLPYPLARHFTDGQLATLRIVGDEVRAKGFCDLTIGEIAARAGVCANTARDAIRAAALDGLVTIEERRRHRAKNLSNVVRIISREWKVWIERGRRIGSNRFESTDNKGLQPSKNQSSCGKKGKGDRATPGQHHTKAPKTNTGGNPSRSSTG